MEKMNKTQVHQQELSLQLQALQEQMMQVQQQMEILEESKSEIDKAKDALVSLKSIPKGTKMYAPVMPEAPVIRPRMHQIIRMYEAVRGGVKRMVLEDATGAGKTYPTIGIFGFVAQDLRKAGKKAFPQNTGTIRQKKT